MSAQPFSQTPPTILPQLHIIVALAAIAGTNHLIRIRITEGVGLDLVIDEVGIGEYCDNLACGQPIDASASTQPVPSSNRRLACSGKAASSQIPRSICGGLGPPLSGVAGFSAQ